MHQDLLENKYTKWYLELIEYKKHRRISETVYTEKHHILPRSLGGSDVEDNLVVLTAKEHFVAHLLLSKMFSGVSRIKMVTALRAMKNLNVSGRRPICNSRQFETVKSISNRLYKNLGISNDAERQLQEDILQEEIDPQELLRKGVCKLCGVRPRGINYYKAGRAFYRSTCDSCARKKKNKPTPKWLIEGYQKKFKCDCCGFAADYKEQLSVIETNSGYNTICLNCKMAHTLGKGLKFHKSILKPDL